MSIWSRIMESMDDVYIDNIRITNLEHDINTIRFETKIVVSANGTAYEGKSYMKHPGNAARPWPGKYLLEELQYDLPNKLKTLADSEHIEDVLLSTALGSAIHSKNLSEWVYGSEGDITQLVKKDDCVLFIDNYGIKGLERSLDGFIQKMMAGSPEEIYILQNCEMYEVSSQTGEMSVCDKKLSEIGPDTVLINNCFYSSVKQLDRDVTEIFNSIAPEKTREIALFGALIVIDPAIIFKEYDITAYGTSQYSELDSANPGKRKIICTPAT